MTERCLDSKASSFGLCVALGFGLVLQPAETFAQRAYPVPGAPYSGGVVSPPGSTLAVIGGIAGEGADYEAAATDALNTMEARLEGVGLDKNQLLRVRAALAPGSGDGNEFAGWNDAWTAFFDGEHLPARTTVGSSGLPGDALVVLDAVAAFPTGAGYPVRINGARATLNPNIRLAGPPGNPTAIVSTRAGLFLSSGALPSRNLDDPTSLEAHIRSSLNNLGSTLANHGLQWYDVFFVRLMPTPQPDRATIDFAAWPPVYASLRELTEGHAPPYTMWAAPGFSATNRFSEIEVWAVPHSPPAVFSTPAEEGQHRLLRMSGNPRSFIASGATIAPNAELLWISGVIAPAGTAPEDEAAAALVVMKERLTTMGASMADVAELRVYRVAVGTDGDELAAAWNAAYGEEWNNPETNPHKPVRTNYLVESLFGRHVEVEALVVLPPRQF